MKKVLMIPTPFHSIPPITPAAVQTWINEVSKRIITYETHVVSIGNEFLQKKEFNEGVYYHRIKFSKIYKRIFQKILKFDFNSYNNQIIKLIKKIQPEIIHIHNFYKSQDIINWTKKNLPKSKIILHMHNINENFNKKNYPNIDMFIGCSQFIVDYYKNLVNAKTYRVVFNGVDIEKFDQAYKNKKIIKKLLNKNNINVFYFGRVSSEKGVDKFINVANLFKNNHKYMFYCAGTIAQKGDRKKFFDSLIRYIDEKKLKNIKFIDYISPAKIHLAYQLADIVLIPSKNIEGFNMVAIECMASRVPIITTNLGGMKEYINQNNALIINDYNNYEYEVKKYIEFIEQNRDKIRDLINNAYYLVTNNFSWQKIAVDTERLYSEFF